MNNFFLIVLDGVGAGELPDAADYNDAGSNTLSNMSKVLGGINIPNLQNLGLGNITNITGVKPASSPLASFGRMKEKSKGKDSTTGHWELAGIILNFDFDYFPHGFPDSIINKFLKENNLKDVLGNKAASGTEIINELGDEHVRTGFPIVYTSADSVFQIAAHENVIPVQQLYNICEVTRKNVLESTVNVGRVIARPFVGENGNFKRTTNRKDFSIDPPGNTILSLLSDNGIKTIAIGKVNDLFNYKGINISVLTKSNKEGMNRLKEFADSESDSFIFTNLVDFDVNYGHRNDPEGFAAALYDFDNFLPDFLNLLDDTDKLIITADHGNDPTTPSTDHSREYVPLLFYQKNKSGKNLGIRETFADTAKTVADYFMIKNNFPGMSFLNE